MNKAFEKIVDKLKDWTFNADVIMPNEERLNNRQLIASENAIKIVQEVAEEYNGGWIPCSERLPEECRNSVLDIQKAYNKAIDDFVNACKEDVLFRCFGLHINGIERIAKQLKAGGENENYNKEES